MQGSAPFRVRESARQRGRRDIFVDRNGKREAISEGAGGGGVRSQGVKTVRERRGLHRLVRELPEILISEDEAYGWREAEGRDQEEEVKHKGEARGEDAGGRNSQSGL